MKTKVFLGGTCEGYDWRKELISLLDSDKVDAFNPIVDDWNEEAQRKELEERETTDFCLYTITPDMKGCYSIAEVVDDSNKRPEKTLFLVISNVKDYEKKESVEFGPKMMKSLEAVKAMVVRNGGRVFDSIEEVAFFLNFKDDGIM